MYNYKQYMDTYPNYFSNYDVSLDDILVNMNYNDDWTIQDSGSFNVLKRLSASKDEQIKIIINTTSSLSATTVRTLVGDIDNIFYETHTISNGDTNLYSREWEHNDSSTEYICTLTFHNNCWFSIRFNNASYAKLTGIRIERQ